MMTPYPCLPGFEPCPVPAAPTGTRNVLAAYPDVAADDVARRGKCIGAAGELLVDSICTRLGLVCCPVNEGHAFDRILVTGAQTCVRVQIKTRGVLQVGGDYDFTIRRGYHRSPGGLRDYDDDAFDLIALVVLAENVVRFTADPRPHQTVRRALIPRLRQYPGETLHHALDQIGHAVPAPRTRIISHDHEGPCP